MSSSSLRIFESCRTTVLASSYHYSTPKLTPLLGRHQQSVFGLHQLPDPSPSAATRRVHCSSLRRQCCATTAAGHYFHPSNVCPPRCEPASLGESERLARWRGTQGRDTHHTHTTHLHTRHHFYHRHPLSAPSIHVCCNSAAGIARSLHHAQSSRLPRPHETRPCCPTPHSTAPITGTCRRPHCPLRYSNTRFSPRDRACRFWEKNSGTAHWRC